jgi:alpha-beta hydrolase superfamily lysophospholipase
VTHYAQSDSPWSDWQPDTLGDGYEQSTLPLGTDPEGEGQIFATLVRHVAAGLERPAGAVLYLHGYTDYFFQRHLAEHFAKLGYAFYAIDLRKCGRSQRAGQTPHYVSDLTLYDVELNSALAKVRSDTGTDVLLMAHSTGGLILPLWLDRLRRADSLDGVSGLILNSPWFDLQGPAFVRNIGTTIIHTVGRLRGLSVLPGQGIDSYGTSLHTSAAGEWDYDLDWKPLAGFPVRFGWLRAIRIGHQRLHRGLDIGVPALILRSKLSKFVRKYGPEVDVADAVLDVKQIQRWSGCLGERTAIVPIENARHDVFLSGAPALANAFDELDRWLDWLHAHRDANGENLAG